MRRLWIGAGCALLLLSGCRDNAGTPDARGERPVTSPSETPTPDPTVPAFVPEDDDVYSQLKRAAGRLVQDLGTYGSDESWATNAAQAAERYGIEPAALRPARDLLRPGTDAVATVVFPQLGGLSATAASVMVVVEQEFGDGSSVTRTVDVRAEMINGRWRATTIESSGGRPSTPIDGLSSAALEVLDNPRITLPDSARWDIARGEINDSVLTLMLRLADKREFSVAVLRSGHPEHVFATSSVSNHTEGRAVDIWAVGPASVVSQRNDSSSPAYKLLRAAFADPQVTEIGAPWDMDGAGGRSFTNDVHLDHIHLGFDF